MKYFAFFGVLAVLVTTGTAAARPGAANDGALSVKNADGRVIIKGRGVVIARFDKGQVTINDPSPNDGRPIVTGADSTQSLGDRTTRYSGSNIRFRVIGGTFSVNVFGTDIDLSAVGRGMVTLNGSITRGNADNNDATYAQNGDPPQPFPTWALTFPLAASQPGPGG